MIFVTGCSKEPPTSEHKIMLEIHYDIGAPGPIDVEYCTDTYRNIYYDGNVELYSIYTLSGVKDKSSYTLSQNELNELYGTLNGKFRRCKDIPHDLDSDYWYFTFYDENGEEVHAITVNDTDCNSTIKKIFSIVRSEP